MKVEPNKDGFVLTPETHLEKQVLLEWIRRGIKVADTGKGIDINDLEWVEWLSFSTEVKSSI